MATAKILEGLKNNVIFLSCFDVASQLREWGMAIIFSCEKQLHPRSLSDQGISRSSEKYDIIKCKKPSVLLDEETNFRIAAPFCTFKQYSKNVFIRHICTELNNLNRIEIVWDQYFDKLLKKFNKRITRWRY